MKMTGPRKEKDDKAAPVSESANDGVDESWPLEADRLGQKDSLIETLCLLAGHYGRRTSPSSLTAGLPLSANGITPSLFIRAAMRADMHARLVEHSLKDITNAPNLPCVLVLKNGQSCILWKKNKKILIVQFPETADEKQNIAFEDLKERYSGYAFFIRPVAQIDERAGPAEIDTTRDWFWSALKENGRIYKDVVVAAVMINLFALVNSLFVMNVYDRVVPNNAIETLWVLVVGVVIVFVFDFILKNLRARFLDVAGRRADVKISALLFEQIMGMTMADRPSSAGVLASHMREFEGLRDFFTSATMVALVDLPFIFVFIVIISVIGGAVAFVPLVAIPIVFAVGWAMQGPLRKVIRQSMNESALKNALLFETISGLETIKVQAAEGHTQRKWEELTDKAARTSVKSRFLSSLVVNFTQLVQQLTSVAVVIVGVFLIAAGEISMGALIACVILSGRAIAPLAQVAGLLTRYNQSREALHQLNGLMKRNVERPKGKHFIAKPHIEGKVQFQDVVFRYPKQTVAALNHINFTIEPGERVAIIGAVGSGKTTMERLILNLYEPEGGSVQLDDIDVRQIDPGDLRRVVGAVQQSPQLFYGTVRENITMGHETISDRAVMRAAEIAGALEFLGETTQGLDTPVGERGEALSGGQRQAVAVARALLYDPAVLILDEPTASMDPASENRLMQRLHVLGNGKTMLIITHKGPMLALVDKVLLLDKGNLVDYGPKDEIIKKLQARQYGTQAERTDI